MVTSRDFIKFKKDNDKSDMRIPFGLSCLKTRDMSVPFKSSFSYGRANRPQTPVKGIILNTYGETAGASLQDKYRELKDYKKAHSPTNNKFSIKCTNAQLMRDEAIKTMSTFNFLERDQKHFKLKRF